jgi:hypothetical protein
MNDVGVGRSDDVGMGVYADAVASAADARPYLDIYIYIT